MSIAEFYNAAQNQEFARDFQFFVRTLGPFTTNDLLYITTANLPGKEITNQQVPFMGLQFNVPGSVKYTGSDAWTVKFRCDEGLNIRNKVENWMKEIFDIQTSSGKYGVPTEVATMDLLGKDLKTIRSYNFIGIYPSKLGEISYDKTGDGKPLDFDVTLSYQFWTLK
jgi:hypothetical protein